MINIWWFTVLYRYLCIYNHINLWYIIIYIYDICIYRHIDRLSRGFIDDPFVEDVWWLKVLMFIIKPEGDFHGFSRSQSVKIIVWAKGPHAPLPSPQPLPPQPLSPQPLPSMPQPILARPRTSVGFFHDSSAAVWWDLIRDWYYGFFMIYTDLYGLIWIDMDWYTISIFPISWDVCDSKK